MRLASILFALVACATVTKDAKTMSGSFETCARADLGQIVATSGTTLLGAVTAIVTLNLPSLEADLAALAAKAGVDGVQCAVAAIDAVINPPTPAPSTKAPLPGLLRAQAWLRVVSK